MSCEIVKEEYHEALPLLVRQACTDVILLEAAEGLGGNV
jgi:hypothetical protein